MPWSANGINWTTTNVLRIGGKRWTRVWRRRCRTSHRWRNLSPLSRKPNWYAGIRYRLYYDIVSSLSLSLSLFLILLSLLTDLHHYILYTHPQTKQTEHVTDNTTGGGMSGGSGSPRAATATSTGASSSSSSFKKEENKINMCTVTKLYECAECGNVEGMGVMLSKCGKCTVVYYCSVDCQRAHWPTHKIQCKELRKALREKGTKKK